MQSMTILRSQRAISSSFVEIDLTVGGTSIRADGWIIMRFSFACIKWHMETENFKLLLKIEKKLKNDKNYPQASFHHGGRLLFQIQNSTHFFFAQAIAILQGTAVLPLSRLPTIPHNRISWKASCLKVSAMLGSHHKVRSTNKRGIHCITERLRRTLFLCRKAPQTVLLPCRWETNCRTHRDEEGVSRRSESDQSNSSIHFFSNFNKSLIEPVMFLRQHAAHIDLMRTREGAGRGGGGRFPRMKMYNKGTK